MPRPGKTSGAQLFGILSAPSDDDDYQRQQFSNLGICMRLSPTHSIVPLLSGVLRIKMRGGIAKGLSTAVQSLGHPSQQCLRQSQAFRPTVSAPQVRPMTTSGLSPLSKLSASTRREPNDNAATMAFRLNQVVQNGYPTQEPPHHLHVYTHKHNTHITLTKPNREPLLSMSCGKIGFRKAQRSKFDAAHQLSSFMMGKIQEDGHLLTMKRLEVVLRGFGPGREAFTKVLLGPEGKNISKLVCRVTDSTRLKFGGCRSRNVRRLG
ncbi:hypothetical protein AJ79_00295 [Helicocarpus griseus UAMH5409]|uniref:Ribosomal protein S11 n=1 Tax=Helicocarpus griseus UAMH5409 TaxID=1447875 RepID=A0A2B7YC88_9EURO|nr:hypothetical protein AJ79_00295 [Helicocarpus griseus UAMH5409]